jgi:plasmid stabilization system protein ParE
MVYSVIWSDLAVKTYISNIQYLETQFTETEIKAFITAVQRKIALLRTQPRLGRLTNKRENVRVTVIHKRVTLIYRYRPIKHEIQLVRFWNNYQNPKRLKSK